MSHDIAIRKIPFEFSDAIDPCWNPEMPEWSHMVNGDSLSMPYLEPFLIKNLREALEFIDDEDLRADVSGFIGQEAQHFTNHRRYNEMLKGNGYPELAAVEASMAKGYQQLTERSLAWRLAYSSGFETMTMGFMEWLISNRDELFGGADPVVSSLILWHMVEETEHKSVAFDVSQAVSGSYVLRALGLIYGSLHVGILSRRGYRAMLQRDGRWNQWRSRLALWRMVGKFVVNAGPAMLRGFKPGHYSDEISAPDWVAKWGHAYAEMADNQLPLLQTTRGNIAPAFTA